MAEQTSVQAGTLSGINLAGDAPEAELPPEDDRVAEAPTTPADEPPAPAPAEPADEPEPEPEAVVAPPAPETETASDGAGDGGSDDPPAPPATSEPEPAASGKSGAPAREYVVLREEKFDSDEPYYIEVHRVESRNAQNAMRRAFKDLNGDEEAEATLIVIPASMWRPTKVKAAKTERVSVSFG